MKRTISKCCLLLSLAALLALTVSDKGKGAIIGYAVTVLILSFYLWRQWNVNFPQDIRINIHSVYIVIAGIICGLMGFQCYEVWLNSGKMQAIAALLTVNEKKIVLAVSAAGAIAAVPMMTFVLRGISCAWRQSYEKYGNLSAHPGKKLNTKTAFVILGVLYIVGISAILRANVYYKDDMARVIWGDRGWDYFGRFLSNELAVLLHANDYLTDISPLTQILAVLIMAIGSILLLMAVLERKEFTVGEVISVVPVCLNPYFLECLSFKFDAPYMALSVLAAVAPLVFHKMRTDVYILLSALGTLAMCMTYQASSGIFPMAVLLLGMRMWMKGAQWKQLFQFWAKSAAGYFIGIIYFYIVIMIPRTAYVSNELPEFSQLLPTFFINLKSYYSAVASDFNPLWMGMIMLLFLSFLVSALCFTECSKRASLLMIAIIVMLQASFCFGLYPALMIPLYSARAMYGVGIFLALMCICIAEHRQCAGLKLPMFMLCWTFFVFSFTYGNALGHQQQYADFRRELVFTDLNDLNISASETPVIVQIKGSIGFSPVVQQSSLEYPILNRLIWITFRGGNNWGEYEFFYHYGLKNVISDSTQDLSAYNLPVLKDTMYHTIYGKDGYVFVELK